MYLLLNFTYPSNVSSKNNLRPGLGLDGFLIGGAAGCRAELAVDLVRKRHDSSGFTCESDTQFWF